MVRANQYIVICKFQWGGETQQEFRQKCLSEIESQALEQHSNIKHGKSFGTIKWSANVR